MSRDVSTNRRRDAFDPVGARISRANEGGEGRGGGRSRTVSGEQSDYSRTRGGARSMPAVCWRSFGVAISRIMYSILRLAVRQVICLRNSRGKGSEIRSRSRLKGGLYLRTAPEPTDKRDSRCSRCLCRINGDLFMET